MDSKSTIAADAAAAMLAEGYDANYCACVASGAFLPPPKFVEMVRPKKEKRKRMSTETARAVKNSKGQGTEQERADKFGVSKKSVVKIDKGEAFSWIGSTPAQDIKRECNKPEKIYVHYRIKIPNEDADEAYRLQRDEFEME